MVERAKGALLEVGRPDLAEAVHPLADEPKPGVRYTGDFSDQEHSLFHRAFLVVGITKTCQDCFMYNVHHLPGEAITCYHGPFGHG